MEKTSPGQTRTEIFECGQNAQEPVMEIIAILTRAVEMDGVAAFLILPEKNHLTLTQGQA